MGYSRNPFGTNRRSNKATKSLINLGIGIVSSISKANKAAKKEAERQRKATERQLIAYEKDRLRAQKQAEREAVRIAKQREKENQRLYKETLQREAEDREAQYILNGYIKKSISFFSKYIALSIVPDSLRMEIEDKLQRREKYIFVHHSVLEELKIKYKETTNPRQPKSISSKIWHNSHPGINSDEDKPDYI